MRKIIDGKIYDTDKAELLAEDSYGYPGDFKAYYESIYKTKKGVYFFYGRGGPMTQYATDIPGGRTGGGVLYMISEEEAQTIISKWDPDKALELWPKAFQEG